MGKNKSAKYKITDTNIDKKIIGKQVTVEKVKSKQEIYWLSLWVNKENLINNS